MSRAWGRVTKIGAVGAGRGYREPKARPPIGGKNRQGHTKAAAVQPRPLHSPCARRLHCPEPAPPSPALPLLAYFLSSPSCHPALTGPMYLSNWASQPRAGRRRYLSSSQSPWRPGTRSSSRVSYTFLGAAGMKPPASTGSEKLALCRGVS